MTPAHPSSRFLLTVAADIVFPAGQKAFSTSLYCPNYNTHTLTHTLTQHPPSLRTGQDRVFVLFSQTAWEDGKKEGGAVVAEKEPAIRGVGRGRISDVPNFLK